MKTIKIFTIFFLITLVGCSTGRIALIDFDLRNPEQIRAYADESKAPYQNNTNQVEVAAQPKFEPPAKAWYWMFDFFKVMQGRFRVLSLEWKK